MSIIYQNLIKISYKLVCFYFVKPEQKYSKSIAFYIECEDKISLVQNDQTIKQYLRFNVVYFTVIFIIIPTSLFYKRYTDNMLLKTLFWKKLFSMENLKSFSKLI